MSQFSAYPVTEESCIVVRNQYHNALVNPAPAGITSIRDLVTTSKVVTRREATIIRELRDGNGAFKGVRVAYTDNCAPTIDDIICNRDGDGSSMGVMVVKEVGV